MQALVFADRAGTPVEPLTERFTEDFESLRWFPLPAEVQERLSPEQAG